MNPPNDPIYMIMFSIQKSEGIMIRIWLIVSMYEYPYIHNDMNKLMIRTVSTTCLPCCSSRVCSRWAELSWMESLHIISHSLLYISLPSAFPMEAEFTDSEWSQKTHTHTHKQAHEHAQTSTHTWTRTHTHTHTSKLHLPLSAPHWNTHAHTRSNSDLYLFRLMNWC